jgi:hypothetical protein
LTPVIDKAMLGIVKKFYGYGDEARKQFEKGVSGEGTPTPDGKKKREDMTPEERAEDDKEKRLEAIRGRYTAIARHE